MVGLAPSSNRHARSSKWTLISNGRPADRHLHQAASYTVPRQALGRVETFPPPVGDYAGRNDQCLFFVAYITTDYCAPVILNWADTPNARPATVELVAESWP